MLANADQRMDIYYFDCKMGSEIPEELLMHAKLIDLPSNPTRAKNAIEKLHRELRKRFEWKAENGLKTMRDGWVRGIGEEFRPVLLIVDEFTQIVKNPLSKGQKDHSELDLASEALRLLIIDALKLFPSLSVFTCVITQSARADQLTMLNGAQDQLVAAVYGRQKPSMARELGLPMLSTDPDFNRKGIFIFDYNNSLTKFRVNLNDLERLIKLAIGFRLKRKTDRAGSGADREPPA